MAAPHHCMQSICIAFIPVLHIWILERKKPSFHETKCTIFRRKRIRICFSKLEHFLLLCFLSYLLKRKKTQKTHPKKNLSLCLFSFAMQSRMQVLLYQKTGSMDACQGTWLFWQCFTGWLWIPHEASKALLTYSFWNNSHKLQFNFFRSDL